MVGGKFKLIAYIFHTNMSIMGQHIHEILRHVPTQEVVPDSALEGVPSVEHQRVGLRFFGLHDSCVEASEATDARRFARVAHSTRRADFVEAVCEMR